MVDVQSAVFAILNGDATLATLLGGAGRVVDAMPESSPKGKYVVLGTSSELPDDTFTNYGRDELFTIDCFAEDTQQGARGWKTVKTMASRVVALLDGIALTVTGRTTVLCHYDGSQSIHDPPWRHVATDFRIVTET